MEAAEDSLLICYEMEVRNGTAILLVAQMGHESEITGMSLLHQSSNEPFPPHFKQL